MSDFPNMLFNNPTVTSCARENSEHWQLASLRNMPQHSNNNCIPNEVIKHAPAKEHLPVSFRIQLLEFSLIFELVSPVQPHHTFFYRRPTAFSGNYFSQTEQERRWAIFH